LSRIALVWLAIDIVGTTASLLVAVGNAVVLAVSLTAGLFADRIAPRAMMIWSSLAAAIFAVVPVVLSLVQGPSFAGLMLSVVGLSVCGALFQPALLSVVPRLASSRDGIQGINALFDSTGRLSRLVGPFLAGVLSLVLPTLHFLTANAVSYLVLAATVAGVGRSIDGAERQPAVPTLKRLTRGLDAIARRPEARLILIVNTCVLAAWAPGLNLGLPFLVADGGLTGFGLRGLGVVAALFAAYGAGDFLSNVLVAGARPKRLGRFMFTGYVILGVALAALPLPMLFLPEAARLPVMMLLAFVSAMGGPMFFLPMMTFLQTHIEGPDLAGVIRLRLALIAASMMIGTAVAPLLFETIGVVATVMVAGGIIAAIGLWGRFRHPDLRDQSADFSTTPI
jgi:DHA3 family macrolide efflux protein-like MFS transporter